MNLSYVAGRHADMKEKTDHPHHEITDNPLQCIILEARGHNPTKGITATFFASVSEGRDIKGRNRHIRRRARTR